MSWPESVVWSVLFAVGLPCLFLYLNSVTTILLENAHERVLRSLLPPPTPSSCSCRGLTPSIQPSLWAPNVGTLVSVPPATSSPCCSPSSLPEVTVVPPPQSSPPSSTAPTVVSSTVFAGLAGPPPSVYTSEPSSPSSPPETPDRDLREIWASHRHPLT